MSLRTRRQSRSNDALEDDVSDRGSRSRSRSLKNNTGSVNGKRRSRSASSGTSSGLPENKIREQIEIELVPSGVDQRIVNEWILPRKVVPADVGKGVVSDDDVNWVRFEVVRTGEAASEGARSAPRVIARKRRRLEPRGENDNQRVKRERRNHARIKDDQSAEYNTKDGAERSAVIDVENSSDDEQQSEALFVPRRSQRRSSHGKESPKRSKVKIGDNYQALEIPAVGTAGTVVEVETLWDPAKAAAAQESGSNVDEFMDRRVHLPTKICMMRAMQESEYQSEEANKKIITIINEARQNETFVHIEMEDSKMEEMFKKQLSGKKDFRKIARETGKHLEAVIVQYYRWKSSADRGYQFCKRMRDEERTNDYCSVCADGGFLIECDLCHKAFHLECLDPPLKNVPEGSWYCKNCIIKSPARVRTLASEGTPASRSRTDGGSIDSGTRRVQSDLRESFESDRSGTSLENVDKREPQVFEVTLPRTREGLFICVDYTNVGKLRFMEYRNTPGGGIGEAQRRNVFQPGDVITHIDGIQLDTNWEELPRIFGRMKSEGPAIRMRIARYPPLQSANAGLGQEGDLKHKDSNRETTLRSLKKTVPVVSESKGSSDAKLLPDKAVTHSSPKATTTKGGAGGMPSVNHNHSSQNALVVATVNPPARRENGTGMNQGSGNVQGNAKPLGQPSGVENRAHHQAQLFNQQNFHVQNNAGPPTFAQVSAAPGYQHPQLGFAHNNRIIVPAVPGYQIQAQPVLVHNSRIGMSTSRSQVQLMKSTPVIPIVQNHRSVVSASQIQQQKTPVPRSQVKQLHPVVQNHPISVSDSQPQIQQINPSETSKSEPEAPPEPRKWVTEPQHPSQSVPVSQDHQNNIAKGSESQTQRESQNVSPSCQTLSVKASEQEVPTQQQSVPEVPTQKKSEPEVQTQKKSEPEVQTQKKSEPEVQNNPNGDLEGTRSAPEVQNPSNGMAGEQPQDEPQSKSDPANKNHHKNSTADEQLPSQVQNVPAVHDDEELNDKPPPRSSQKARSSDSMVQTSQSGQNFEDYGILVPVGPQGRLSLVFGKSPATLKASSGYSTVFSGYSTHNREPPPALKALGVFKRLGDLVLSVDGIDVRSKTHQDVIALLKNNKEKRVRVLLMRTHHQ